MKILKYSIYIAIVFFSSLGLCQTWAWKYNLQNMTTGVAMDGSNSIELSHRSGEFKLRFMATNMDSCFEGYLDATAGLENDNLVIYAQRKLRGCDRIRLTLKIDGSGGVRARGSANNTWIPDADNFDRGLNSLNKSELPSLYAILKNSDTKNSQPFSTGIAMAPPLVQPITTPAPLPVAATPSAPARVAAIGNVEVPVKATVGQTVPNQPTQVTSNPIDQVKKTSGNEVWISFNPSITIQQRQFCRIVENFRTENAIAIQSKNQIKVNETFRNLSQSLNSLLPDGKFQGWVMRTVAVDQASDGSAEVLMEMPCNIYVGSNACDANPSNYYGTAPEGSRMYTELAKMTVGDFALTSGQFVYVDDKAFDKNRSVASFRYMRTAAHCKAKQVGADTEFFGTKLDVISTIK
ncbi:MAG: hypothetical protein WCK81_06190 [Betaproteobacteria bacterium]